MLLREPEGRVLLIRFVVPQAEGEFVFWAMPGGEIEDGETDMDAAQRELAEELGLELRLEGPVRVESNCFLHQGEMRDNTDYYFLGSCPRSAPLLAGVTEEEIRIMKEMRWFSLEELERMARIERIFPEDLVAWLRSI